MTLFDISEKAETLRANAEQVLAANESTNRRDRWQLLVLIVGMAALTIGVLLWSNRHVESQINVPAPASVLLQIDGQQNQVLCPGDTLTYAVTTKINERAMVLTGSTVKYEATDRAEIIATPVLNMYDETGVIHLETNWTLPDMLPATATKPVRPWRAGKYKRLIGAANAAKNADPSIARIDFEVGEDCPGVVR